MSCRDRRLPRQILPGSEFDRELPRFRYPQTIRPAKAWPILNACTAGCVGSDAEHEREHGLSACPAQAGHGGEAGGLQQLAESALEIVHRLEGEHRTPNIE